MSNSGRFDHLVNLMKSVANVKEMCDANLVAGKDNQKFPVHRLIMRAASEYFHSLLGPNFREGSDENIVLKDINGETLKSIIEYIYHGEITIDHQNVCAIAAASSWMQLIELEKRCAEFGENDLNAEICIEILLSADDHHLVELKSKAFDMICANFGKLSIDKIAKIDATTYQELLMCDALSGTESNIFKGLVRWLASNKAEKDDSILELLKWIRLKHIPKQILMDTVEPFFLKHNQMGLVFEEYRRRLLDASNTFGSCRWSPKDVHLVSMFTGASARKLMFIKYDKNADDWTESREMVSKDYCGGKMVVANDKLYVMGGMAPNGWPSDMVCAYDLRDFTRVMLPNMTKIRAHFASVVAENFIYVFGAEQARYSQAQGTFSCERFDVVTQKWTMRNNMPMGSQSGTVTAIEYNGCIYVGFTSHSSNRPTTQLYWYDPAYDLWKLNATAANRAILAKTSTALYVIEDNRVLHLFDPTKGALTKIGDFIFDGCILHTIEIGDEIYLLGDSEFVKLNLQENVKAIKLKMTKYTSSRCLYLK